MVRCFKRDNNHQIKVELGISADTVHDLETMGIEAKPVQTTAVSRPSARSASTSTALRMQAGTDCKPPATPDASDRFNPMRLILSLANMKVGVNR
ncbi:MAG: hypothetical protein ABJN65_06795 [Parasphingorhabdus sp.]